MQKSHYLSKISLKSNNYKYNRPTFYLAVVRIIKELSKHSLPETSSGCSVSHSDLFCIFTIFVLLK